MKGKQWENPDVRRQQLYEEAYNFFALLPVGSHVFAEEPLALKNGKTTRLLGLAAGAIWAAHLRFSMFWYWVDVATWKSKTVGNGNATKDEVQAFVRAHDIDYPEEDLFDAHCLMVYGERQLAIQGFTISKTFPIG